MADSFGHGRESLSAGLDVGLFNREQTGVRRVENELIGVLALEHAGIGFIILQRDHHALEAGRDLPVRKHDGFEQVFAILLTADVAEVRAAVAAFAINFMAANALGLGTVEEDFLAIGHVAAEERRAKVGKGIIPGLSSRVAGELLFKDGSGAFGSRVEQIKAKLVWKLASQKIVEPMREERVNNWKAQSERLVCR